MFIFEVFIYFISAIAYFVHGDEILGCGGFVKSDVQLDFSRIQIKLFTKQGSLKDHTDCAPNNGYYFIPLYDKGEYLLKLVPPNGWSFDITEISLNVDGSTDLCSLGKDINFHFKGFGITGQVVSIDSDKGPAGVKISYVEQEKTRETLTTEGGYFHFTPVVPGSYVIAATHPKWQFLKNAVKVSVKMANTEIPTNSFIVAGYDVTGRITSTENEPLANIYIVLYNPKIKRVVLGCSVENIPGYEQSPLLGNPICSIKSNENGVFEFPSIPPGKYTIVPFYKKKNVQFEMQPKQIEFVVEHNSLELDRKFQVTGLTVSGKAILPKDNTDGATIILNDQEKTMTNSNGEYTLSNIRPGTYRLTATADNVLYEVFDLVLSPTKYTIETLKPKSFKACGQVISDEVQNIVYHLQESNQAFNVQSNPDGGHFCLYLVPGIYEVQVVPKDGENIESVQFYPLSQTVEVKSNSPAPIIFSQLKATVTGDVKCYDHFECGSLQVELKSMYSGRNYAYKASVQSKGTYKFTDIPPGRYSVTIIATGLCWEQEKFYISINSEQAQVQTFIQNGYRISFRTDYDSEIQYEILADNNNQVLSAGLLKNNAGSNLHCLPKSGRYRFIAIGCHGYEPKSVEWSTSSSRASVQSPIVFNAITHAHGVEVISDDKSAQVQLYIKETQTKLNPQKSSPTGNQGVIHHFTLQLQQHQTVTIQPQSKLLLFKPESLQLVGSSDCVPIAAEISGVKGKIIEGAINPPLAGVQITVQSQNQQTQVFTTLQDGKFHFGPLDGTNEYQVTAMKDNYYIHGPDKNGNFVAHKMADILVESLDENNQPLSGVLVSVSGGDNYRKNLQTDQNGQIQFTSLNPGEYFIRPMMKEYRFDPNSKMTSVKEGDSYKIKVIGKRIAFSGFGFVQSLSGLGEPQALVIATSTSKDKNSKCFQHIEEATTDITGAFRIRGLLPTCSYHLQMKDLQNSHGLNINQISKDVHGLYLISLQPPAYTDVTVSVYTPKPDDYRSLRVKLGYADQLANPIQSVRLDPHIVANRKTPIPEPGVLVVLNSVPYDNKRYYVQLDTSVSQASQTFDISPVYFYSNTSFKHIALRFEPVAKHSEYDLNSQTSILVLPLIIFIGLVFYNSDKVILFTQKHLPAVLQYVQTFLAHNGQLTAANQNNSKEYVQPDYAEIEQIVQNINATKPKPKKRAMLIN